jgi:hypothetical protein
MLSHPKSAVHQQAAKLFQQHWRHLKGKYDFNSTFHANTIISELVLAFTEKNIF